MNGGLKGGDSIKKNLTSFAMAQTDNGGSKSTNRKDIEAEVNAAFDATIRKTKQKLANKSFSPVSMETADQLTVRTHVSQPITQVTKPQLPKAVTDSAQEQSQRTLNNRGITQVAIDFGSWTPVPALQNHIQHISATQENEPVAQTFADVYNHSSSVDGQSDRFSGRSGSFGSGNRSGSFGGTRTGGFGNAEIALGLTGALGTIHNIAEQTKEQLIEEGTKLILAGEMPSDVQLEALGLDEPSARGMMAVFRMATLEDIEMEEELPEGYSIALNIGRSVGAKAKSYLAYNPLSGEDMPLTEGTRIIQPKNHVIAGKGRDRQIDEIQLLLDSYGGDPLEWTKEKGFGYVDDEYGESHYVELHWYQEPSVGQAKMKI